MTLQVRRTALGAGVMDPQIAAHLGGANVPVILFDLTAREGDDRKIIARRAAMELRPNSVVNVGVGIPEGVAAVTAEEKCTELMTLTCDALGKRGVAPHIYESEDEAKGVVRETIPRT